MKMHSVPRGIQRLRAVVSASAVAALLAGCGGGGSGGESGQSAAVQSANGEPIAQVERVQEAMATLKPGQEIEFHVQRGGAAPVKRTVTLKRKPFAVLRPEIENYRMRGDELPAGFVDRPSFLLALAALDGKVLEEADAKRLADVLETGHWEIAAQDVNSVTFRRPLAELNLESQTLVIYVSDNGGITHTYPANNGPLRDGKGSTYEGGIRVPAVMQWPGVIPPGTVSTANAVHFDLFSTILEAASVAVPKQNGGYDVSGVSLLTHLRSGARTPLPDRYLFWDLYGDVAAVHGPWKLVGEIPNHHGKFDQAVRDAEATQFALYNLDDDPGEQTDVSPRFPDIYRDLKSRHLEWLRRFAR